MRKLKRNDIKSPFELMHAHFHARKLNNAEDIHLYETEATLVSVKFVNIIKQKVKRCKMHCTKLKQ